MNDTLCYALVVCICFSNSLLGILIASILKMRNLRSREVSKVAAVTQLMMVMVFIRGFTPICLGFHCLDTRDYWPSSSVKVVSLVTCLANKL